MTGGLTHGVRWWLLLACFAAASCRTPVPDAMRHPSGLVTPGFPDTISARQTVVLSWRPHWWWPSIRITALGYVAVDRANGDFTVVCLSPLGLKIFEAARRNGVEKYVFSVPVKGDIAAIGRAIGMDIEGLYFGLEPPKDAVWRRCRGAWVATVNKEGRLEEWHYSRDTGRLMRKAIRAPEGNRTIAIERYGGLPGKEYPARVVVRNSRYRYALAIQQDL